MCNPREQLPAPIGVPYEQDNQHRIEREIADVAASCERGNSEQGIQNPPRNPTQHVIEIGFPVEPGRKSKWEKRNIDNGPRRKGVLRDS